MSLLWLTVGLVALERLLELAYSARNARRLLAAGGREAGRRHYPLLVGLHVAWLLGLLIVVAPAEPPRWPLLLVFLALQGLRVWVIASLGWRWTTRVIALPRAPLVRRGPYRWLRHPNYLVVIAEIAVLPLAFGAWQLALVFTALNLALLRHRVRIEEQALAGAVVE